LGHRGDMGLGDDQKMDRRPGVDVMKRQKFIIFIDFFAGNFASNDLAKDAVGLTQLCAALGGVVCAHGSKKEKKGAGRPQTKNVFNHNALEMGAL